MWVTHVFYILVPKFNKLHSFGYTRVRLNKDKQLFSDGDIIRQSLLKKTIKTYNKVKYIVH